MDGVEKLNVNCANIHFAHKPQSRYDRFHLSQIRGLQSSTSLEGVQGQEAEAYFRQDPRKLSE